MSTIYPALNAVKDELEDELKDKLEDLGDILLCWRHRKDTEQVKSITGKWTRAIQEFVRKGGDEVMGEPHDTISSLDAEISDLMERRLRLVHMGEHTQIKSERRGAGFK